MLDTQTLQEALRVASETARAAGQLVMQGYRAGAAVRKKGTIDLVTDFDLRSEDLIRERLRRAYPEFGWVAEEGGAEEGVAEEPRACTWCVDPIDGTTNFAHGHPFFAISIALYDGDEPVLGVVHAPALGVHWSAASGCGAWRNEVRCRVSETRDLQDALCATGFPYDRATSTENNFREFLTLKRRTRGVRRCGSAALDLALVADGTYDAYWEQKLQAWDLSAGAVLVREAGGALSDYDAAPADPRTGRLAASNGVLHAALLAALAEARALPPL